MTRLMFDAYVPGNLPATSPPNLYAAYVNGVNTSNNYAQVKARFPAAQILSISTNGDVNASANVADVEPGDYTIGTGIQWARNQIAFGLRPTLYSSRSDYGVLYGNLGATADYWVATLDGTHFTGLHVVACQYTDNGGQYDTSIVYDDSWHALAVPTPPPIGVPKVGLYVYAPTTPGDPTLGIADGVVTRIVQAQPWHVAGAVFIDADHTTITDALKYIPSTNFNR